MADDDDDGVERIISNDDFKKIMDEAIRVKNKVADLSGGLGKKIAESVDEKNLHRGAFNDIRKAIKMDALKRSTHERMRAIYWEKAVALGYIQEPAGDMFEGDDGAEGEGDAPPRAPRGGRKGGGKKAAESKPETAEEKDKRIAAENAAKLQDGIKPTGDGKVVALNPNAAAKAAADKVIDNALRSASTSSKVKEAADRAEAAKKPTQNNLPPPATVAGPDPTTKH